MVYSTLKFIINEVLYNGHLQSLGAASIVYTASVLLNYPVSISLLVITYFVFQTIYFHDRYQGFDHDYKTNIERTKHLKNYYHLLPVLIFTISIITYMILASFASFRLIVFSSIIIFFGFLYPLIFKKVTKYIPLFKNFYVSLVFTLLVFFPSVALEGEIFLNNMTLILLSFVFMESMISQIILDMKDKNSDKKQGLMTLSVMINKDKVMMVLWSMSLLVFIIALSSLLITPSYKLIALLAVITFFFNSYMFLKVTSNERQVYLMAAGKYLLWPLVLILLLHV